MFLYKCDEKTQEKCGLQIGLCEENCVHLLSWSVNREPTCLLVCCHEASPLRVLLSPSCGKRQEGSKPCTGVDRHPFPRLLSRA